MEEMVRIPAGTVVLVSDGRKALILRNDGNAVRPSLQLARALCSTSNPLSHEHGSARPGRVRTGNRRSALEAPNPHDKAERAFAHDVAELLNGACADGGVPALIVVAPPKTLAELRRASSKLVRQITVAELDKDLTKLPVHEIERHVLGLRG